MRKEMTRGRKIRRGIGFSVLALVVLFAAYLCVAIFPYAYSLEIGDEFVEQFDVDNFYSDTEGDERVMLLDDRLDAFYHRLKLIDGAEEEILFATYQTYDTETTQVFFGGLLKKAEEGVKVRIVLDGKFSGIRNGSGKQTMYALYSNENVELLFYNPINLLRPTELNACMHEKYLVADRDLMIMGGRNLGDRFFAEEDENEEDRTFYDREVLVYNAESTDDDDSSIHQTREYFEELTGESVCKAERISEKHLAEGRIRAMELIDMYDRYVDVHYGDAFFDEEDYEAETVATNRITLVHNPTQATMKEPWIGWTMGRLTQASECVTIQTPYLSINSGHLDWYREAVDGGTEVRLLTNSLAGNRNLAYYNYYVRRKTMLRTGMEIYEYQGSGEESVLHTKTYIFDDRLCAIGSYNMDERSMSIDTECMLVIDSPEFTAQVEAVADTYFDYSLQVGEDNKYVEDGEVDALRCSVMKRTQGYATGVAVMPIMNLL